MKNVLLLIAISVLGITQTQAQCTPNPIYADSVQGFYPAPMPALVAGQPYNAFITIVTPRDTCVTSPLPLCLYVQASRINSIIGLPSGFTFSPTYDGTAGGLGAWLNTGGTPNWNSTTGCLIISASAADVDAAIAANSGDTQLHYTYVVDMFMKNQDPQSPILSAYTWGSTINVMANFDINGGGTGNPIIPPSGCATVYFQGNQTSFAGLLPTAGTFDLDIVAPGGCNWVISGSDTWFSYSVDSGTGDTTVTFTYDANTTGQGRWAELDIDGQAYIISQMAEACAMNIMVDTTIFDPTGGFMVFYIVMSDPDCYWNLVTRSYCDWLHLDPESGTGSTNVTVTVDPNPDNQVRQCELDFGNGHTFSLNQSATVGITENKATVFDLYPNPANDFVTIATPAITGKEVVSIYTIAGQLLSQTQLTNTKQQISTSNLANGMYVITVQNAQGIAGRKKVVINR